MKHRLACPACGFETKEGQYGSFEICSICCWEDDPVQLADPWYAGGANSESLIEAQAMTMAEYPPGVELAKGYIRNSDWRPVQLDDKERVGDIDRSTEDRGPYWLVNS